MSEPSVIRSTSTDKIELDRALVPIMSPGKAVGAVTRGLCGLPTAIGSLFQILHREGGDTRHAPELHPLWHRIGRSAPQCVLSLSEFSSVLSCVVCCAVE